MDASWTFQASLTHNFDQPSGFEEQCRNGVQSKKICYVFKFNAVTLFNT